jgi:hypothetical protein
MFVLFVNRQLVVLVLSIKAEALQHAKSYNASILQSCQDSKIRDQDQDTRVRDQGQDQDSQNTVSRHSLETRLSRDLTSLNTSSQKLLQRENPSKISIRASH